LCDYFTKARLSLELEVVDIDDEIDNEETELSFENMKSTFFDIHRRDLNSLKLETNKYYLVVKNLNKCRVAKDKPEFVVLLNYLAKLDFNLAFAYLLQLKDEELVDLLEDVNPSKFTNKSFEFLLHLVSLNIIRAKLDKDNVVETHNQRSSLYDLGFKTLVTFLEQKNELLEESPLGEIFKRLNRAYIEFNQTSELQRLEMGIDLKRFETDQQYKHETILGLSEDIATFGLAVSLAKFYEFDLWMVYMSFTKYLLTDEQNEEMSLDKIEEHVKPLLSVLRQKSEEYDSVMFKKIYRCIEGTDLNKLSTFYTLLSNNESELHVKTIKKLKSLNLADETQKIDYKNLLENPYETVEPYLDDETNLQIFTKLLPKLPVNNKSLELKPSKLYAVWCLKRFWSNLDSLNEADLDNEASLKSLINDNFDSLVENIKKLDTNTDFVFFIKELTMNRKCCEKLSVGVRRDLLKRINRLVKQMDTSAGNGESELTAVLNRIQNHLKLVESLQRLFTNQTKNFAEKNKRHVQSIDKELGNLWNFILRKQIKIIETASLNNLF
jgi:hypothetical protein